MAKKSEWTDRDDKPAESGFEALAALRASLPPGPAAAAPSEQATPAKAAPGPARAVVRLERKGRGGKDATIIEQLELAPAERERWLKELKARLGCGGAIEGETLVLQGDLRQRLEPILRARGVRRITVA